MAIGGSLSVGLIGLKAFIIQIQAFISPGLPYFSVIGLPDASLSESRERVKSACQASGFKWPDTRVTVAGLLETPWFRKTAPVPRPIIADPAPAPVDPRGNAGDDKDEPP